MKSTSRIRSRGLAVASAVVLASLALASCAQGSATSGDEVDGKTVVRYMNFSANDGHESDIKTMVTAFEKANPDVVVRVETVPYAGYMTKLQTAIAGDTVADTFEVDYDAFSTYAASGALTELKNVDSALYKENLLDSFAADGKQYALPGSFSNVVLFYNKDLFEAAGIPLPTNDWTWADEKAAAEQLTNRDAGVWGDIQPVTFNEFYKVLEQSGGTFFNDDESKVAFNSPEGAKAAEWLISKPGTVMPTDAEGANTPDFDTNLFKSGKLAIWHSGVWMFNLLKDVPFGWDIVVEPGDVNKATAMFSNGVAVSSASKNPEAAQKWVEFLTSSDTAVSTRLASSWEIPPVADDSRLADYVNQTPPANRQAVLDSLDYGVTAPMIERQAEMSDAITTELGNAAAGRKTIEQALSDAETTVNGLLK